MFLRLVLLKNSWRFDFWVSVSIGMYSWRGFVGERLVRATRSEGLGCLWTWFALGRIVLLVKCMALGLGLRVGWELG